MDERVTRLLALANKNKDNHSRLLDVAQRLRGVSMSQALGCPFGGTMTPEQETISQDAADAARRVERMARESDLVTVATIKGDGPNAIVTRVG